MAKNWKKAHDKLKAEHDVLIVKYEAAHFDLKLALSERNSAENRASLACAHMEAAADQFAARGVLSTAALLRREADRLYGRKAAPVTNAKADERQRP